MSPDTQSWLAAVVVVLTLGAFGWRWFRTRSAITGCGGGCACPAKSSLRK